MFVLAKLYFEVLDLNLPCTITTRLYFDALIFLDKGIGRSAAVAASSRSKAAWFLPPGAGLLYIFLAILYSPYYVD